MIEHAELGASSAHRWMACPGSVRLTAGLPEISSSYALEGTAAHALAALALNKRLPTATWIGTELHSIEVTEEMAEAVQLYVDAVETIVGERRVEQKFSLAELNPPAPMFGTADAIVYEPRDRLLHVIDLKYGRGVAVEVVGNPQLRYYALGALLAFERERQARVDAIRITIVQPRSPHPDGMVRSETVTYDELVGFAAELLDAARTTLDDNAALVPGEHCRFCRAAGVCPALKERATAVARVEFDALPADLPPVPETLPAEVLADILDKADILEDWLRSVRAHVVHLLETGRTVPGWKLVPKRATRKWIASDLTVEWCQQHGIDPKELMTTPELISVAQAERFLKTQKLKLPTELYHQTSAGTTLAPDADPRPAVAAGPEHDFPVLEGESATRQLGTSEVA
jgi:hypothetical protein